MTGLELLEWGMLERMAADTWPAAFVLPLEAWLLRADPEIPAKRCNSVLTAGAIPESEVDWMEQIELFYAEFGFRPRFHISAASPGGLDEQLAEQGYVKEGESLVLTATVEQVLKLADGESHRNAYSAEVAACHNGEWLDAYLRIEQFDPHKKTSYHAILDRISGPKAFVLVRHNETAAPAGVGTAVVNGEWAGLINIATDASHRRQGVGVTGIRALAAWSAHVGVHRMYLQVVADYEPAVRLYEKLGFRYSHRYHYRTGPAR
ncbi:GNAT family N-acetyltransferase [Paenibacillus koleovorans]|uniref:GNAT family N-acetyltransferase n=1 Tax=Paenibacillus koleovorans TaxID=121608 RepID=UPI0013E40BA3|nr:GNAT family N-acetyltransferase [Paenibacillus koleovorans]